MKLPTAAESLFSLKSYVGAMAALYLSLTIGLPRPFWAVTTAYIVAQPWAGAVRSKAVFRLGGTFVGSAATVYMVPQLADYPVLMVLAMALWVGICLYVSMLDRTPRSYLFMLAGYTAALIGLPSVLSPGTIFDTALARVEEISLGIVCAALAHSLILPRGIGPAIVARLDTAVDDARAWTLDTLRGKGASQSDKDRRVLANDITELRLLSTHIPFDTGHIRWTSRSVRVMQDRLAGLTPIMSSIEDRLHALHAAHAAIPATFAALLDDIAAWIETSPRGDRVQAAALRSRLAQAAATIDAASDWNAMLLASLAERLRELVEHYEEGLALYRDIQAGLTGVPPPMPRHPATSNQVLHRDHGMALLSALAAGVAIVVCCAFWIGTAWTSGATAALIAAVFSCFFAAQDNPVPSIMQFLKYTIVSIPLSAVYLLAILPAVHSFETLALSLFPPAFLCGVYIARPSTAGKALAMMVGFSGTLALHDTNTANIASFLDSTVAQVIGLAAAAVIAAVFRKVSAEFSARRIQAANWRALAGVAAADRAPPREAFTVRMLDRIGLLQSRLAARGPDDEPVADDALRDLRIGNDIVELQHARRALPIADAAIRPVLDRLSQWFRTRDAGSTPDRPTAFLGQVDRALEQVNASPADSTRARALGALVGIRRALFPDAPGYRAALPVQTDSPAYSGPTAS